ncbi:hypothetical protein ACQ5SK_15670 [Bradyrhizobium japonicum]
MLKGALSRALGCVDVGVDLPDYDLGAIEREAIQLVAEAFAVVVRPEHADRTPDFLLAAPRDRVNPMGRSRGRDRVGHVSLLFICETAALATSMGRLRSRRMSGVIKASRQAPGRAELHTRSTEAKGLDDDARLDKNGALRDRFVGGVLFLNGRLSEKPGSSERHSAEWS